MQLEMKLMIGLTHIDGKMGQQMDWVDLGKVGQMNEKFSYDCCGQTG